MSKRTSPFNSPLETGVRALSILEVAHPEGCDLHAALPMRAGELLVRRELIEKGLLLMVSRGLVERIASPEGILYRASEAAGPFVRALRAPYSVELCARADWAIQAFGHMSTDAIRAITQRFFEKWTSEFQPNQLPGLGA